MLIKIIGAICLVGFFYLLSKVSVSLVGKDNPLAKAFPIGSTLLVLFFLGLIFF
ncbi:MAG: hypothetical protein ACNI25_12315 [Halarcobacter sp.]